MDWSWQCIIKENSRPGISEIGNERSKSMYELGKYLGGRMDRMLGGRKRIFRDCGNGSFQRRLRDESRKEGRVRSLSTLHVMLRSLNFIL